MPHTETKQRMVGGSMKRAALVAAGLVLATVGPATAYGTKP